MLKVKVRIQMTIQMKRMKMTILSPKKILSNQFRRAQEANLHQMKPNVKNLFIGLEVIRSLSFFSLDFIVIKEIDLFSTQS